MIGASVSRGPDGSRAAGRSFVFAVAALVTMAAHLGAMTFSTPVRVDDGPPLSSTVDVHNHDLAVAPDGSLHAAFIGADLLVRYTRAAGAGLPWSAPVEIGVALYPNEISVVSGSGGLVAVAWLASAPSLDGRVVEAAFSYDGGTTFGPPRAITVPDSDLGGMTLRCDSRGRLILAWATLHETTTFIMARSDDFGLTWKGAPVPVTPARFVGYDVAVDANGDWLLVWSFDDESSKSWISFSRSSDAGITWRAPSVVAYGGDQEGWGKKVRITAMESGRMGCAWTRNYETDIRFALSTDGGITWPFPCAPIALPVDWFIDSLDLVSHGAGDLYLGAGERTHIRDNYRYRYRAEVFRSHDSGATWKTSNPSPAGDWIWMRSASPSLAVDPGGGVHASWIENRFKAYSNLFSSSSTDGAVTWSNSILLDGQPGYPTGAAAPGIAVRNDGSLLVYWSFGRSSVANPELRGSVSPDHGKTWGPSFLAVPLDPNPVVHDVYPIRPEFLALNGDSVLTAWSTGVYLSVDGGQTLVPTLSTDLGHPVMVTTANRVQLFDVDGSGPPRWPSTWGVHAYSDDGGVTWSSFEVLIDSNGYDDLGRISAAGDGDILHVVEDQDWGYYRSVDEGTTWLPPVTMPGDPYGQTPTIVRLNSGRLLVLRAQGYDPGPQTVETFRSEDRGMTWTGPSPAFEIGPRVYNGFEVVEDGNTIIVLTNVYDDDPPAGRGQCVDMFFSTDGGDTWLGPSTPPGVPRVGGAAFEDGILHLVWWQAGEIRYAGGAMVQQASLLRNDEIRSLSPVTPDLATAFGRLRGGTPYRSLAAPGEEDPDASVLTDTGRPLVLYEIAEPGTTVILTTSPVGRIRLWWY